MKNPTGILAVIPSRLQTGESFTLKIKVLGPVCPIPSAGNYKDWKPQLHSAFNLNACRMIQFHDNCLPKWQGILMVDGGSSLSGPLELIFDGVDQGVFPGDTRPIKEFTDLSFTEPGFHFIKLTDSQSGINAWTNPVYVTVEKPKNRIYWGDPHWQTFFSDGIRCPEELYAFARDEAFLDFGAISDHMEAVTDYQWDYFQAVTNGYNAPGCFATLIGQEWTHHDPQFGAPGHRNIYYRGDKGPAMRSTDTDCNTLQKLWDKLDSLQGIDSLAIPHHTANVVMGVNWDLGWNPKYEKAVEIYSVWGSSEKPKDAGNTRSIKSLKGEMKGRHVIDALKKGYRMGFVGGGDIHDGRPGDDLHSDSYPPNPVGTKNYPQGFTAAIIPELTRDNVFSAICEHKTYASSKSRIYLEVRVEPQANRRRYLTVRTASEHGIIEVAVVVNGEDIAKLKPAGDRRIVESNFLIKEMLRNDFCYIRVLTENQDLAWSSPFWGDE